MTRDTSFETYCERARGGGVVPVVREFSQDVQTPVATFAAVARPPFAFLLESLVGGERWARYTFLGTEPAEVLRYGGGIVHRWTPDAGWTSAGAAGDPLAHLASRLRALRPVHVQGLPRFTGGAVGYLGYDAVRAIERLPGGPRDDLGLPDALFMIADTLVVIDNAFSRALLVANTHVAAVSGPRTGGSRRRPFRR